MDETLDTAAIIAHPAQPSFLPKFTREQTATCGSDDGPMAVTERINHQAVVPYSEGIAAETRPILPGYDSGILGLVMAIFLIVTINARHTSTYLKTFAQDLLTVRRRSNVFDDHTVTETRITVSFMLLACVCEGILAYSWALRAPLGVLSPFGGVAFASCVAMVYYLFELAAYSTVASVFGGKFARVQWVKGFNASQSLLGLTLVVPSLIVLFNPALSQTMWAVGATLYVIARFIFICKGFRIFYKNPYSLIYFILYLCTLEIAPLLTIYRMSANPGALNL